MNLPTYQNRVRVLGFVALLGLATFRLHAEASAGATVFVRPTPEKIAADLARTNPDRRHPRILMDGADLARIREAQKNDPTITAWCASLRGKADTFLKATPVKYGLSSYSGVLPQARRLLSYAQILGLTYRLTGEVRYAERLWQEIDTVCDRSKFPDWGRTHYNDAVEMGTAFAIAYDWVFDYWSDERKQTMRQHMRDFTLRYVVEKLHNESLPENGKTLTNIRLVYAGGAAVTALAIADEPDSANLACQVIAEALRSDEAGAAMFAPDGGWYEGARYWGYAVRYHIYLLSSLRASTGTTYGFVDAPGFRETGGFPIQMAGPAGNFNFHDDYPDPKIDSELSWLGREFDVNVGRKRFAELAAGRAAPEVVDVLYFRPEFAQGSPEFPLAAFYRAAGTAVFRSGWDAGALFLGIHVGPNVGAHAHLDMGTFILDADGRRWVSDVGGGSYDWKGYLNSSEFHLSNEPANMRPGRFDYYCTRAEGHNTLLVGAERLDLDQNLRVSSKILRYEEGADRCVLVADLTDAYRPRATGVRRGFLFSRTDRTVVVRDELEAATPTEFTWSAHTVAEIAIAADRRSAVLSQGDQRLWVGFISPGGAKLEVGSLPPEPEPKQTKFPGPRGGVGDYDRMKKLMIREVGVTKSAWSVAFIPLPAGRESPAALPASRPISAW